MNGCQQEAEDLLQLADTITASVPGASKKVSAWRSKLENLKMSPELESIKGEKALNLLALELRRIWLKISHNASDRYFKSPLLEQSKFTALGTRLEYSYERNLPLSSLEKRAESYRPAAKGWEADHVAFSSGQAAMLGCLMSYLSMISGPASDPLRLGMWGNYFETHMLLHLLSDSGFGWQHFTRQTELCEAIKNSELDIVVLEPVAYDWSLEALDLNNFITAFRNRTNDRTALLIVDTTLIGSFFPMQFLLASLSSSFAPLVIQVSSSLKLDQAGLELSNMGLISIYSANANQGGPKSDKIAYYIRKMRTILGSSLSLNNLCALEAPWVLDRQYFQRYCKAVFVNNSLLAHSINEIDGLFMRVAHPSLVSSAPPWAQAPFTVLHLKEDILENHGLLLSVIASEASRRKISFKMGSSFGFRFHRFETIVPKVSERKGLFKVAMGASRGPSRNGVIELLREIAEIPNFDLLRKRYPDCQPISMDLE